MLQDHEILDLLNTGKQRGMEVLFERYYKPLVVFADAYLHDLQGAEDLVQEQIIKLWTKRAFENIAAEALSTFLFTVVRNACINWAEKKKLRLTSLDLPHFQIALEEAEQMDDAMVQLVRDAMQRLPEKTRRVVECVMLQEKMYKEAAEELGVSINTVKTLLKQGMKELRTALKGKQELLILCFAKLRLVKQSIRMKNEKC